MEIEVDTLDQLDLALACHPDIILVDNFDAKGLVEAVKHRDQHAAEGAPGSFRRDHPGNRGGTGKHRCRSDQRGRSTHSAPALDIGLDFEEIERP